MFWGVLHIHPGSRDKKGCIITEILVGGPGNSGVIPCRLTDLSRGLSFQKGSVAHDSFLNDRELVRWVS
jgi:hypothetical protein